MERSELFDLMGELQLYGMKAAFDEIMTTAVKRQHEPQRIIGDLLTAEVNEKEARSIKYQLTIAKLPLAKDLDDFQFEGTPINETLVRDLAGGGFLAQQRNAVLVPARSATRRAEKTSPFSTPAFPGCSPISPSRTATRATPGSCAPWRASNCSSSMIGDPKRSPPTRRAICWKSSRTATTGARSSSPVRFPWTAGTI